MAITYGIDISEHQGNINLEPYKNGFVIIRAAYGSRVDKKFDRNVQECERLGIPYGVYHYSYALNRAQAKEEAQFFLKIINGLDIKVGCWFDMEDADSYKRNHGLTINANTIGPMCKAWCDVVSAAGYYTGIYASQSWLQYLSGCNAYDKWVANWGINDGKVNVATKNLGSMLQYTSRLGGKSLDGDLSYYDLSIYNKKKAKNPEKRKKIDVDALARDVILGKYGVGSVRKNKLGSNYDIVQKRVDQLYKLAHDTVSGKYGNGEERKRRLGSNYKMVQWLVDRILLGGKK